jgi:hypothetical protein
MARKRIAEIEPATTEADRLGDDKGLKRLGQGIAHQISGQSIHAQVDEHPMSALRARRVGQRRDRLGISFLDYFHRQVRI